MKYKITLIITVFFYNIFFTLSQNNTTISLLKYSEKPNFKSTQTHKLEIKNTDSKTAFYTIKVINTSCKKEVNKLDVTLSYRLFNDKMNVIDNTIKVASKSKKVIYLELKKSNKTKLDTWYCSEINLYKSQNKSSKNIKKIVADKLLLKTFIPNPKNFN